MATITISAATAEDVSTLLDLVRELALFENEPEAVVATEADLLRHGFGPERRFEALIALADGKPAGFALFFPNFSTWEGRPGLYLEDLFVSEWARKHGVGRRLMARLAAIAVERGWARFDLSVLHWNPARQFYHRIGMRHLEEWLPYRVDGAALRALAAEDAEER
ncbi:MAG TPA: GNAT family N-acetyltransferase [Stellaceae bacterium]|nr:GNAT family N-acetyltransferase [Stellaceae bacterium]